MLRVFVHEPRLYRVCVSLLPFYMIGLEGFVEAFVIGKGGSNHDFFLPDSSYVGVIVGILFVEECH